MQNKPRVVLDTNILISGFLFPNSIPALVIEKALINYNICASTQTWAEFSTVLRRPKFEKYFHHLNERENIISHFYYALNFFDITITINDCRDAKDNPFLELAVSAQAKYLVTGDKQDLLSMNPYRGISIIRASEFLALA